MNIGRRQPFLALLAASLSAGTCSGRAGDAAARASGYVEATDVRVAPQVGGRLIEVAVSEGDRINTGALVARLDTADADLSLRHAEADRDQAVAARQLLEAGARPEDIRQARAQVMDSQRFIPPGGARMLPHSQHHAFVKWNRVAPYLHLLPGQQSKNHGRAADQSPG